MGARQCKRKPHYDGHQAEGESKALRQNSWAMMVVKYGSQGEKKAPRHAKCLEEKIIQRQIPPKKIKYCLGP